MSTPPPPPPQQPGLFSEVDAVYILHARSTPFPSEVPSPKGAEQYTDGCAVQDHHCARTSGPFVEVYPEFGWPAARDHQTMLINGLGWRVSDVPCVFVFATLNRYFYLSTSCTPIVRADYLSQRDTTSVWPQAARQMVCVDC